MTAFRHPAFAKLSPKIDRAAKELMQIEDFLSAHGGEMAVGEWGAVGAVSLGLHNVYNGIEDVLLSLANDIDGLVPQGQSMHQDLLDQMHAEIAGTRPAMLDPELYEALGELKGFRHLVRHRYGFDLTKSKVEDNLKRIRTAFPAFLAAVESLEKILLGSSETDDR
ncbi:MAG: hypothetical protein Q8Q62_06300 [Mesorhizobium sp.]|nr:hypothetical protein [Mesorhizobium sp.]